MSARVDELFQTLDEQVAAHMRLHPADPDEALLLMHGLCQRAAFVALASVEPEPEQAMKLGMKAAAQMVALLLQIREEIAHKRTLS